jgi:hypothetical protein
MVDREYVDRALGEMHRPPPRAFIRLPNELN